MPSVDGATVASLLITYGVEIGLDVGRVSRASIADYLRVVAEALDIGLLLPSLTGVQPEKEPPF